MTSTGIRADGQIAVRIRAANPGDEAALAGFLATMDRDGLYSRHFAHGDAPNLALLRRLAGVDGQDRAMLLAIGADGLPIGHAEYVAEDGTAEFALMVAPAWRNRGLGKSLLAALLKAAERAGQRDMQGLIQATNTWGLRVARQQGFGIRSGDDRRTVIISRSLAPGLAAGFSGSAPGATASSRDILRHDPDRIPLHSCAGA